MKRFLLIFLFLFYTTYAQATVVSLGSNRWTGLNADVKPTTAPNGSIYTTTDTPYQSYIKTGGSWVLQGTDASSVVSSATGEIVATNVDSAIAELELDKATIAYVDSLAAEGAEFSGIELYLTSVAAEGIFTSYELMDLTLPAGQTTELCTTCADDTLLDEWITNLGEPELTTAPHGIYVANLYAKVNEVTAYQTAKLYMSLYKIITAGTETQLGTTSVVSDALTTATTLYPIYVAITEDVPILATDRFVLKIYVEITGSGTTPDVYLYYGSTATPSHLDLNIVAQQLVDNTAYGATWDADVIKAPSKNAVYDKFVLVDADIAALGGGLGTETENTVFAGPGAAPAATPTFRALVDADIPAAITRDTEHDTWAEHPALTNTTILIGSAGNVPTEFALSGDATMTAGGVVTVGDNTHVHTGTSITDGGIDISTDTNLTADGSEIVLTGDALSLGASVTRDAEWDTATEIRSAIGGTATGTGNLVFATSPTITTPVISSIVNSGTLTLPTSSDTLVGRATTDTLTNKSLSDSTTTIVDVADTTKKLKFDVTGTTAITGTITSTFTTAKTITLPDSTGTVALTSDITGTNSGTNTGDQTITLTGDVTGSGTGSFAATIAADSVDTTMVDWGTGANQIDSTDIPHTPSGTGASATTVKAKLEQRGVDITDFGARADVTPVTGSVDIGTPTAMTVSASTGFKEGDNIIVEYAGATNGTVDIVAGSSTVTWNTGKANFNDGDSVWIEGGIAAITQKLDVTIQVEGKTSEQYHLKVNDTRYSYTHDGAETLSTIAIGLAAAIDADSGVSASAPIVTINATTNTITVADTGDTFTRTSGSFLSDGLVIGGTVVTTNFTNSANNGTFKISNLTATVMTVTDIYGSAVTLTNETNTTVTNLTWTSNSVIVLDTSAAGFTWDIIGVTAADADTTVIPEGRMSYDIPTVSGTNHRHIWSPAFDMPAVIDCDASPCTAATFTISHWANDDLAKVTGTVNIYKQAHRLVTTISDCTTGAGGSGTACDTTSWTLGDAITASVTSKNVFLDNSTAITNAIAQAASSGTYVYIPEGTFYLGAAADKTFTLTTNTSIYGSGDKSIIQCVKGCSFNWTSSNADISNVAVKDFTIDGIYSSSSAKLDANNFDPNYASTAILFLPDRVNLKHAKDIKVSGMTIKDVYSGISVINGTNVYIDKNYVYNTHGSSLTLQVQDATTNSPGTIMAENLWVTDNYFERNHNVMMYINGTFNYNAAIPPPDSDFARGSLKGVYVINNTVKDSQYCIEFYGEVYHSEITGNSAIRCGSYRTTKNHIGGTDDYKTPAILLKWSHDTVVADNVISQSGYGIDIAGHGTKTNYADHQYVTENVVVSNNVVMDSYFTGVLLFGAMDGVTVSNNIINGSQIYGLELQSTQYWNYDQPNFMQNVVVNDNIIANNPIGIYAYTNVGNANEIGIRNLLIKDNMFLNNNVYEANSANNSGIRFNGQANQTIEATVDNNYFIDTRTSADYKQFHAVSIDDYTTIDIGYNRLSGNQNNTYNGLANTGVTVNTNSLAAYAATWNGSNTPATQDTVYDEIELRAPKASPTFTGTVTVPVTGSTQCLNVDTNGVVSGTGAACGGAGESTSVTDTVTLDLTLTGAAVSGAVLKAPYLDGANGETIANGTDDQIILTSVGGTNNENLIIDLDSAADTIALSTSTGAYTGQSLLTWAGRSAFTFSNTGAVTQDNWVSGGTVTHNAEADTATPSGRSYIGFTSIARLYGDNDNAGGGADYNVNNIIGNNSSPQVITGYTGTLTSLIAYRDGGRTIDCAGCTVTYSSAFHAADVVLSGTPTLTNQYGFAAVIDGSLTKGDNIYGFHLGGITGSTNTANYGLYLGNVSGGTNNYAIKTGTGLVDFGDVVQIAEGTIPTSTDGVAKLIGDNAAGYPSAGSTVLHVMNENGVATAIGVPETKCSTISYPTASSDFPLEKFPYAITIRTINVYSVAGTNVIGGYDECTGTGGVCSAVTAVDADITGTADTNVADDGSLTNAGITAGNWIKWHTTSISGTPTSATVCFSYTID